MGQKYLIAGDAAALRMWHEEAPSDGGTPHTRDYETVGYIVSGKVEVTVDGETTSLSAGDSWPRARGRRSAATASSRR